MKPSQWTSAAAIVLISAVVLLPAAEDGADRADRRARAAKLLGQGNYKEAHDIFSRLALDPSDGPKDVPEDLNHAIACLRQLNRVNEIDAFREAVIAAHGKNWRLLQAAAKSYMAGPHYGVIVAGDFKRGPHRGGRARWVNSFERDRVRALQLMQQGLPLARADAEKHAVAAFHMDLAGMLLANRGFDESWRLQYLSDLSELPDYEEGHYRGRRYHRGGSRGAPVDADGDPVFHHKPESWKAAKTDGERWRWALEQVTAFNPNRLSEVRHHFASFCHHQFGVQTMREYAWYFRGRRDDDTRKDTSGTYELHTLGEDETIARLANGIRRFKLPKEFNFVRIFKDIADGQAWAEQSVDTLARIFENRRQYPRAAEWWRQAIDRFGPGAKDNPWRRKRLDQIVKPWGRFEPVRTAPAGRGATVEFRFRNGGKLSLTAHEIDVGKLLGDVKAYVKSRPRKPDWWQLQVENVGYRLVTKNQRKYVGKQVAAWTLDLKPRPAHFDKLITVTTPLQKPGAYLLTAHVDGGNTSRIILWVADTAVVRKQLDGGTYYFVADAVTGKPVAKANLEFFGYRRQWKRGGNYVWDVKNFAEFTDGDGQCIPDPAQHAAGYTWLVTATTQEGRLAFLGFNRVWYGRRHDQEYKATKVFVITDRPVYRPAQPVKFKFWVNHARYDQEGKSAFAGKKFTVRVNDPKGEKIFEKSYTADEYGGFDGELTLGEEAALGVYRIWLPHDKALANPAHGGSSFRVEEYKKPEFEVTVEAPKAPIMLGEKITAKIAAKYYFGAPVTKAKVKYKVLRTEHDARWYPVCPWDWFYGSGYWWFAYDYAWYPGWERWGCKRPHPWWWWRWHPRKPPEVVAEAEAPIGEDGTLKVVIDTAIAKAVYGHTDHKYEITAEVTDASRRTIVGAGKVLVARKPFKVYAWVDRGHYRVGDTVEAHFKAQTLDRKPVTGDGVLRLLKVTYERDKAGGRLTPVETEVARWDLGTDVEGRATRQMKASAAGQYRISYTLTDAKGHAIEGGYVFVVRGEGFDGSNYRFNDIELVTDKREYAPGDKVKLMINTNRAGAAVVLFVRAANGVGLPPKVLRLTGKSAVETIAVVKKDMPNFFVEAFTVHSADVHTDVREVIVPPASRVLKVRVEPSGEKYKPAQKAKVKLRVTDESGEPVTGSVVLSVYDKAVEYISGGSNVPEIKAFFWKWRRHHRPRTVASLDRGGRNLLKPKEIGMSFLGVFGYSVADEVARGEGQQLQRRRQGGGKGGADRGRTLGAPPAPGAPMAAAKAAVREGANALRDADKVEKKRTGAAAPAGAPDVQPTVRTKFADTALWVGDAVADAGRAEFDLTMPENLTTWKVRCWAMGPGTRCGEGTVEVVTTKDLIIRLQAPRFFVQTDEVVLSANVHNYLKTKKKVKVVLELAGGTLEPMTKQLTRTVEVPADGEKRVDWRVKAVKEGTAKITMKALTDEESDAMAMEFPVYVHGMLKTESFSGVIRPDRAAGAIQINVPKERRPAESRLEVRYSPTLAGAMVDALPYMVEYPYGCTEQTLNRFVPTVITQKVLLDMGLDLTDIRDKRINLNAQEIGDDVKRNQDWKRLIGKKRWDGKKWVPRNPVFDADEVRRMVKAGLARLTSMQCSDGGWGWFSGWGERSWPHTTAVVVHGLQVAKACDVAIVPGVLDRGVAWLKKHQAEQVRRLKLPKRHRRHKAHADNLDALVYMVLVDAKIDDAEMRKFLYRDRNHLSVYAKAMFGLALHKGGHKPERDMLKRNVEQFLVTDDENQTAYLRLPEDRWWWCWYGSEYEAHAYYLKLLAATEPRGATASRLVKYLINNRRHATYWNSTRDTALVVEAFADYIKASGEDKPDMTVTLLLDGKRAKRVKIDAANLFSFDNKLVLTGKDVATGRHKVELRKKGDGPLYYNAYLTNFTLEDPITRAGLEIKVRRDVYRLERVDKAVKDAGSRGQVVDRKVEKYKRVPLKGLDEVASGDLLEIELVMESKNDYEYIVFEDMKAAGCEPVALRSGYGDNEMGAYMELRDERVTFFVRRLARGRHSLSYRVRAEVPGRFSALPTKASAMYAPELKANSDEFKLRITD